MREMAEMRKAMKDDLDELPVPNHRKDVKTLGQLGKYRTNVIKNDLEHKFAKKAKAPGIHTNRLP